MDATNNPFVQAVDDGEVRQRRVSVISVTREIESAEASESIMIPDTAKSANQGPTTILEVEEAQDYVDPEDTFPEGGRKAWSVVVGAFLMLFPSFGLQVSIGTLQDYWAQNQLAEYSARDIGWIPSLFVYLGLALGLLIGPMFDRYGPTWIIRIGTTSYVIMIFLLAECTKYWQFMLCCGLFGGICAAMLTTTGLAVVSHWFKARRGLVHGISMIGSSFGGLTIPLVLRATFPKYGYRWSIRILGFMFLACFIVSNLLCKARIPPSRGKKKAIISLSIFKDARFCFLTVSTFGVEVVLFGVLGILPTYATVSTDFAADTGFYLIALLNGSSCFGRIISGYLSDRYGRFNVFLVGMLLTLLIILVIWLPFGGTHLPALYLFSALFGFCTGSWMALLPACIGQLCRAEEFGTYFGSLYFLAGTSLLITIPVSGELVEAVGAKSMIGFYTGVLVVSILTFYASRQACLGWKWGWKEKI